MKIVILDIFAFYSTFFGLQMKYYKVKFFFTENTHRVEHLKNLKNFLFFPN